MDRVNLTLGSSACPIFRTEYFCETSNRWLIGSLYTRNSLGKAFDCVEDSDDMGRLVQIDEKGNVLRVVSQNFVEIEIED